MPFAHAPDQFQLDLEFIRESTENAFKAYRSGNPHEARGLGAAIEQLGQSRLEQTQTALSEADRDSLNYVTWQATIANNLIRANPQGLAQKLDLDPADEFNPTEPNIYSTKEIHSRIATYENALKQAALDTKAFNSHMQFELAFEALKASRTELNRSLSKRELYAGSTDPRLQQHIEKLKLINICLTHNEPEYLRLRESMPRTAPTTPDKNSERRSFSARKPPLTIDTFLGQLHGLMEQFAKLEKRLSAIQRNKDYAQLNALAQECQLTSQSIAQLCEKTPERSAAATQFLATYIQPAEVLIEKLVSNIRQQQIKQSNEQALQTQAPIAQSHPTAPAPKFQATHSQGQPSFVQNQTHNSRIPQQRMPQGRFG